MSTVRSPARTGSPPCGRTIRTVGAVPATCRTADTARASLNPSPTETRTRASRLPAIAAAGRTARAAVGAGVQRSPRAAAVGRVVDAGAQRVAIGIARGPADAEIAVGPQARGDEPHVRGATALATVQDGAVADEPDGRGGGRDGPDEGGDAVADVVAERLGLDARVQKHAPVRVE